MLLIEGEEFSEKKQHLKQIEFRRSSYRNMWLIIISFFLVNTYQTLYSLILFFAANDQCYLQSNIRIQSVSTIFARMLQYDLWVYPMMYVFWPQELTVIFAKICCCLKKKGKPDKQKKSQQKKLASQQHSVSANNSDADSCSESDNSSVIKNQSFTNFTANNPTSTAAFGGTQGFLLAQKPGGSGLNHSGMHPHNTKLSSQNSEDCSELYGSHSESRHDTRSAHETFKLRTRVGNEFPSPLPDANENYNNTVEFDEISLNSRNSMLTQSMMVKQHPSLQSMLMPQSQKVNEGGEFAMRKSPTILKDK